MLLVYLP